MIMLFVYRWREVPSYDMKPILEHDGSGDASEHKPAPKEETDPVPEEKEGVKEKEGLEEKERVGEKDGVDEKEGVVEKVEEKEKEKDPAPVPNGLVTTTKVKVETEKEAENEEDEEEVSDAAFSYIRETSHCEHPRDVITTIREHFFPLPLVAFTL